MITDNECGAIILWSSPFAPNAVASPTASNGIAHPGDRIALRRAKVSCTYPAARSLSRLGSAVLEDPVDDQRHPLKGLDSGEKRSGAQRESRGWCDVSSPG